MIEQKDGANPGVDTGTGRMRASETDVTEAVAGSSKGASKGATTAASPEERAAHDRSRGFGPRSISKGPTALGARPGAEGRISRTLTLRFLTYVFGGGVEHRDAKRPADPITPVRASAIRGQLRFWWRATNPHGLGSVDELWERERLIFGAVHGKAVRRSPLVVRVVKQPAAPREVPIFKDGFRLEPGFDALAYGAFPLRASSGVAGDHGALLEYAAEFELALEYPEAFQKDLDAAVWAWMQFGGLGARTRRGFGAVAEVRVVGSGGVPSKAALLDAWRLHVGHTSGAPAWPRLPVEPERALHVVGPGAAGRIPERAPVGTEAHAFLLQTLRMLRQASVGRQPQSAQDSRRPGRSHWPEADEIRRMTRRASREHAEPKSKAAVFPRAQFGLPIIFHFKDDGDPRDTTLQPVGAGRWGSPLIIRPWGRNGEQALALRLEHPEPGAVELLDSGRRVGREPVRYMLQESDRKALPNKPLWRAPTLDPIELYFTHLNNGLV